MEGFGDTPEVADVLHITPVAAPAPALLTWKRLTRGARPPPGSRSARTRDPRRLRGGSPDHDELILHHHRRRGATALLLDGRLCDSVLRQPLDRHRRRPDQPAYDAMLLAPRRCTPPRRHRDPRRAGEPRRHRPTTTSSSARPSGAVATSFQIRWWTRARTPRTVDAAHGEARRLRLPCGAGDQPPGQAQLACDVQGVNYLLEPAAIDGGIVSARQIRQSQSAGSSCPAGDAAAGVIGDLSTELTGTQEQVGLLVDGELLTAPTSRK